MRHRPGWYPDAYLSGRERYWDGRVWTGQLRTAVPKVRPHRRAPPPPTLGEDLERAARPVGPSAGKAQARTARKKSTAAKDRPARVRAGGTRRPEVAATEALQRRLTPSARPAPVTVARTPWPGTAAGKRVRHRSSRRRRRLVVGGVAIIVIIVVVAGVAAVLVGHKSGAGDDATAVSTAAAATLHEHTATMTFHVKPVRVQGPLSLAIVSALSGKGDVDVATGSASLNLTEIGGGGNIRTTERLIIENRTLYVRPGPLVGPLLQGRSWISATVSDLVAPKTTGFEVAPAIFEEMIGNPKTFLEQIEASGVIATSLGSSTYQGTYVHGYGVTLTRQEIDRRLSPLSSSLRRAASGVHATEDVYVTTGGLVRAIVVPLTVRVAGYRVTEDVHVVFSDWGGRVHVVRPSSSAIVRWATLKAELDYTSRVR